LRTEPLNEWSMTESDAGWRSKTVVFTTLSLSSRVEREAESSPGGTTVSG